MKIRILVETIQFCSYIPRLHNYLTRNMYRNSYISNYRLLAEFSAREIPEVESLS